MDPVLQGLYARAQAAQEADDHPEMLRAADAILARSPADAVGLVIAGAAFLREKRFGMASQFLGAASLARPEDPQIWNNLACSLQEWHPGEALKCLEKAMALDPELDEPVQNCVSVLSSLGRFEDAATIAEDYLKRSPHDPDVNHNGGLAFMQLGRWEEAFACWSVEAEDDGRAHLQREHGGAFIGWDGQAGNGYDGSDGEGEIPARVVIYGQQGVGDEIMAASVYDEALESGAEVILECEPRLEHLLSRSFPKARVFGTLLEDLPNWPETVEPTQSIGAIDCMGLYAKEPFRRGRYLETDPKLVAMFRALLDGLGDGLKVGIAWRGGHFDWDRAQRCIDPVLLSPIVKSDGCHFVSLEYDAPDALPEGVHDFPWAVRKGVDMDMTAALIDALDLVISVPQTCVDVAGALGKPCWVLTPPVPQWRFSEKAGDVAWVYQSVEIIRRQGPFWQGAIGKAAQRLRDMAAMSVVSGETLQ